MAGYEVIMTIPDYISKIEQLEKEKQELIDYLKEKIEACDKYIKIHKREIAGVINISNKNRHLILINTLSIEKDVYEKILNKIEKSDK